MDKIVTWLERIVNSKQEAKAIRGGIAKDPNYIPNAPLFVNGKAKNEPIFPHIPFKIQSHPGISPTSPKAERFQNIDVKSLKMPKIDTRDGKLSPAKVLDQYLENVEGGKKALIKETNENYKRDSSDLPWKRDIEKRDTPISIETNTDDPDATSHFNPLKDKIVISPYSYKLTPAAQKYNGFPATPNSPTSNLSTGEVVLHEISHAATFDFSNTNYVEEAKLMSKDIKELLKPNNPNNPDPKALKRPYMFSSSEEYKVGTLIFLNKSRQLTGSKLTNPQQIHQLFDEIEKDPSILDKNYTLEEARIPRTYLLLKETNPKAAEMLRNATARDCQYLAKNGQNRFETITKIANLKGPEQVSPELIEHMAQFANPHIGMSKAGLSKELKATSKDLQNPTEDWVNKLVKFNKMDKTKNNHKELNAEPFLS